MHSFGFKLVVFFGGFYLIIRFYQLLSYLITSSIVIVHCQDALFLASELRILPGQQ